eukprot:CAMPEP_0197241660 /NCGR_PEP_ID=MMETSP1429-20130617/7638_1 /TAXON_ID=49237 /ORGANISM="Chaetoceros  sp., Strain UNC1202" /LENGTH=39 /DNA_ID= /DNA_START= /DNA_END= /DNA_ORIENTATION=
MTEVHDQERAKRRKERLIRIVIGRLDQLIEDDDESTASE